MKPKYGRGFVFRSIKSQPALCKFFSAFLAASSFKNEKKKVATTAFVNAETNK